MSDTMGWKVGLWLVEAQQWGEGGQELTHSPFTFSRTAEREERVNSYGASNKHARTVVRPGKGKHQVEETNNYAHHYVQYSTEIKLFEPHISSIDILKIYSYDVEEQSDMRW